MSLRLYYSCNLCGKGGFVEEFIIYRLTTARLKGNTEPADKNSKRKDLCQNCLDSYAEWWKERKGLFKSMYDLPDTKPETSQATP